MSSKANSRNELIAQLEASRQELDLSQQKEKFMVEHTDALTVLIEEANARTEHQKKVFKLELLQEQEINFNNSKRIKELRAVAILGLISTLILLALIILISN